MPRAAKPGEWPCPACVEPVAVAATRCPVCHVDYTPAQILEREFDYEQASKRRSNRWLIGIAAAFVIAVVIKDNDPPPQTTAERLLAPPKAAAAAPSATPSGLASGSPAAKAGYDRFEADLTTATQPCDTAAGKLGALAAKLGRGGSIYDGYSAARKTNDACASAWSEVLAIEPSADLPAAARDQAELVIPVCAQVMLDKQSGAKAMMEVLDGDFRPSLVEAVRERGDVVEAGVLRCAAGMLLVGSKAGVSFEAMGSQ